MHETKTRAAFERHGLTGSSGNVDSDVGKDVVAFHRLCVDTIALCRLRDFTASDHRRTTSDSSSTGPGQRTPVSGSTGPSVRSSDGSSRNGRRCRGRSSMPPSVPRPSCRSTEASRRPCSSLPRPPPHRAEAPRSNTSGSPSKPDQCAHPRRSRRLHLRVAWDISGLTRQVPG